MKKILFLSVLVSIVLLVTLRQIQNEAIISPVSEQKPTPTTQKELSPARYVSTSYNNQNYIIYYSPLLNKEISLIPNFTSPISGSRLAEKSSCTVASSGGFYTKENTPLGFFKTNGNTLSRNITKTNLITGYFYITDKGTPHIGAEAPENAPTILQTGPLFTSSDLFPTKIDEPARRIVIIEDTNGMLYIAGVVSEENSFSGPFLSDIPPVIFSIREPFKVHRVLNLDGGAASFYRDETGFSLPELVRIGSMVCIK